MENIIIPNKIELERKIKKISEQGKAKLHIISDFDGTLTKEFVNGKKVPSIISYLRDGNYLTQDYAEKAHSLYNKYHPIEINLSIPFEERKRKMLEWWKTHYDLLIKCGLDKKDLKRLSENKIKLRESITEFLWREDGKALKIKEPIIHSLNKKEEEFKKYSAFQRIKDRKNVILIGNT